MVSSCAFTMYWKIENHSGRRRTSDEQGLTIRREACDRPEQIGAARPVNDFVLPSGPDALRRVIRNGRS